MSQFEKFPNPAFHFAVFIGGDEFSCQEVSGLEAEIQYEKVSIGGGGYRFTPKGIEYSNVVFKRGFIGNDYGGGFGEIMKIFTDAEFVDTSGYTKKFAPKTVRIELLNAYSAIVCTWILHGAIPVKWKMSGFNSMQNEMAYESLELSYHYFTMV